MTEEQKRLKEHFLEPETRCGHYVSAETKACWKVMLDMLEEVDRICRKHGIKYFLIAGSLLGAIRHKGFIPWDDDVDIALFRDDYDRLCKILPRELPPKMFMQTLTTDPEYTTPHVKIRLSCTAAIMEYDAREHKCCNMGIFIDLFALDGIPKTKFGQWFAMKLVRRMNNLTDYRAICRKTDGKRPCVTFLKKVVYGMIWKLVGLKGVCKLREWSFARFHIRENGECIQNPGCWGYNQRYRYSVADFARTVDVPFEYLTLMVPANYDNILKDTYGDWHKIVKGDSAHSIVAMNATDDYKTILADKFGYTAEELERIP